MYDGNAAAVFFGRDGNIHRGLVRLAASAPGKGHLFARRQLGNFAHGVITLVPGKVYPAALVRLDLGRVAKPFSQGRRVRQRQVYFGRRRFNGLLEF